MSKPSLTAKVIRPVHSSGSPTYGHCSCTEPRSCTGTILASVSNETRYEEHRESSNGNEPTAAAETGQNRVEHNNACSDSAIDDDNDWTIKQSKNKTKQGLKVTFGSSVGGGTTNSKFTTNLQALEKKRGHSEHSTRPIDALTFDRANTVASVGGQTATPENMKNLEIH